MSLGCWCRCLLFELLVVARVLFIGIDGRVLGHAIKGAGAGAVLGRARCGRTFAILAGGC